MNNNTIPTMPYGKYKGTKIDQLPNSYLKWMLGHDFPEEYLRYARKKVNTNVTSSIDINVTRHALDKFSLKYMHLWKTVNLGNGVYEGLASYVARMAYQAFETGEDVSKHRRDDDEIRKKYQDITYVFNSKGELKTLITVL